NRFPLFRNLRHEILLFPIKTLKGYEGYKQVLSPAASRSLPPEVLQAAREAPTSAAGSIAKPKPSPALPSAAGGLPKTITIIGGVLLFLGLLLGIRSKFAKM
ncbi:MAG: hypothetical protein ABI615_12815, partial [Chthoniobacterales bacterium]